MRGNGAYLFADGQDEEQRLTMQATALDPLTARVFDRAGLAPGMTVLDVGTGAGDVAALAAAAVGPTGRVVGIDRDPMALERAGRKTAGRANTEYRHVDIDDLDGMDETFDAVVGRAVFMHVPDPTRALAAAARRLRPGGLLCVHEPDMTYRWTSRPTPLWTQVRGWILDTLERAGVHNDLGPALLPAFREAGLPDPELLLEAPIGSGDTSPAFGWANIISVLLPIMETMGTAPDAPVDTGTIRERLDAEAAAYACAVLGPLMYGAWCRVPGA